MFRAGSRGEQGGEPGIVAGITAYLREHFPEVEFTTVVDGKTHSVIFRATCRAWYRLEVTTPFLEGAEGTTTSLEWRPGCLGWRSWYWVSECGDA
jgi:hypothetical protein